LKTPRKLKIVGTGFEARVRSCSRCAMIYKDDGEAGKARCYINPDAEPMMFGVPDECRLPAWEIKKKAGER